MEKDDLIGESLIQLGELDLQNQLVRTEWFTLKTEVTYRVPSYNPSCTLYRNVIHNCGLTSAVCFMLTGNLIKRC